MGERERVELLGRGEPAAPVAPAAAGDDELPERLLRGAGDAAPLPGGCVFAHGDGRSRRVPRGRVLRESKDRSTARGVSESDYMSGNLLQKEVEAKHVADAFLALALMPRTTGHVLTVDGGNTAAELR